MPTMMQPNGFSDFNPLDVLAAAASLQSARTVDAEVDSGEVGAGRDGDTQDDDGEPDGNTDGDGHAVGQKDDSGLEIISVLPACGTSGKSDKSETELMRPPNEKVGRTLIVSADRKKVTAGDGKTVLTLKDTSKGVAASPSNKALTVLRINKQMTDHSYAFVCQLQNLRSDEDEGYSSRSSIDEEGDDIARPLSAPHTPGSIISDLGSPRGSDLGSPGVMLDNVQSPPSPRTAVETSTTKKPTKIVIVSSDLNFSEQNKTPAQQGTSGVVLRTLLGQKSSSLRTSTPNSTSVKSASTPCVVVSAVKEGTKSASPNKYDPTGTSLSVTNLPSCLKETDIVINYTRVASDSDDTELKPPIPFSLDVSMEEEATSSKSGEIITEENLTDAVITVSDDPLVTPICDNDKSFQHSNSGSTSLDKGIECSVSEDVEAQIIVVDEPTDVTDKLSLDTETCGDKFVQSETISGEKLDNDSVIVSHAESIASDTVPANGATLTLQLPSPNPAISVTNQLPLVTAADGKLTLQLPPVTPSVSMTNTLPLITTAVSPNQSNNLTDKVSVSNSQSSQPAKSESPTSNQYIIQDDVSPVAKFSVATAAPPKTPVTIDTTKLVGSVSGAPTFLPVSTITSLPNLTSNNKQSLLRNMQKGHNFLHVIPMVNAANGKMVTQILPRSVQYVTTLPIQGKGVVRVGDAKLPVGTLVMPANIPAAALQQSKVASSSAAATSVISPEIILAPSVKLKTPKLDSKLTLDVGTPMEVTPATVSPKKSDNSSKKASSNSKSSDMINLHVNTTKGILNVDSGRKETTSIGTLGSLSSLSTRNFQKGLIHLGGQSNQPEFLRIQGSNIQATSPPSPFSPSSLRDPMSPLGSPKRLLMSAPCSRSASPWGRSHDDVSDTMSCNDVEDLSLEISETASEDSVSSPRRVGRGRCRLGSLRNLKASAAELHPLIDHDYCMFTDFNAQIQSSIIATTETKTKTERKYPKKGKAARTKLIIPPTPGRVAKTKAGKVLKGRRGR